MPISRTVARIVGPTLVAVAVTEFLNLDAFAGNPAPVVYLDGTLLFVAGIALVQAHARLSRLLTATGIVCLLGGLYRMGAPYAPQATAGWAADVVFAAVVCVGALLTWQGYGRSPSKPAR